MFCVDAAAFWLPNLKASQFLVLLVRIYLIWFNLIKKKFIKSWKDWWYTQSVTRKSFCECVECPALNKYCNQYQSSQAMHHLRNVITYNVYIVRTCIIEPRSWVFNQCALRRYNVLYSGHLHQWFRSNTSYICYIASVYLWATLYWHQSEQTAVNYCGKRLQQGDTTG